MAQRDIPWWWAVCQSQLPGEHRRAKFLQPGAYIAVLQPLTLWDEHLALIRPDFSAGHLFPEPSLNLPLLQTLLRPRRGPGWPWAAFV